MTTNTLTHKQGSTLFKFTGLKFWEPENNPPPTIKEASDMIGLCFQYIDKTNGPEQQEQFRAALVAMIRRWFSEWDGRIGWHGGSKKKKAGSPATLPNFPGAQHNQPEARPQPEHERAPERAPEPEPENEPESQHEPATPPAAEDTAAQIQAKIRAGLRNLWLYGPAGTGKTTLCKLSAEALGVPYTLLSCSAGTSPSEILGHKFPEPRPSPVSRAVGMPGIVVFDEITMLDASVAAVANALLANGEIETSTGHVTRHPDCVIIATANTVGDGADRQYIGNNQLDAATLDRFTGGMLKVEYSHKYEAQYDAEVVAWVQRAREKCSALGLRRILSTRAIIAADMLKKAGHDWKSALVDTWTESERRAVGA